MDYSKYLSSIWKVFTQLILLFLITTLVNIIFSIFSPKTIYIFSLFSEYLILLNILILIITSISLFISTFFSLKILLLFFKIESIDIKKYLMFLLILLSGINFIKLIWELSYRLDYNIISILTTMITIWVIYFTTKLFLQPKKVEVL